MARDVVKSGRKSGNVGGEQDENEAELNEDEAIHRPSKLLR
jgi:hypothetical protein